MENNCGNCKHFQKYYYVNGSLHFTEANCGRCLNERVKRRAARKYMCEKICCEFWESDSETVLQTEEKLKNLLIRVSRQLSEVAELIDKLPPRA